MRFCAAQSISPNLAQPASPLSPSTTESNQIKYKSTGDSDRHEVYFCNCRHSVAVVDRTHCARVPVALTASRRQKALQMSGLPQRTWFSDKQKKQSMLLGECLVQRGHAHEHSWLGVSVCQPGDLVRRTLLHRTAGLYRLGVLPSTDKRYLKLHLCLVIARFSFFSVGSQLLDE